MEIDSNKLWQGIKNTFWDDETSEEADNKATSPAIQTPLQANIIPVTTPNAVMAGGQVLTPTGVVSEEFSKHFESVLNSNEIPGIGYAQFKNQLSALEGLRAQGVQEDVLYKTALASLTAGGNSITKETIVSTAKLYLDLLTKDDEAATKAVEQRKVEQIGTRNEKISNLKASIVEKQNTIQKLNAEIQQANTDITNYQGEILQQSNIIEQRHQNYKTTLAVYTTRLQQEIGKIEQFLPSAVETPVKSKK